MKVLNIVLVVYTLMIFIGGLIGFIVSGSTASILMSSIFSGAFIFNFVYSKKNPRNGYIVSATLTMTLLLFFFMRFIATYAIMPAGLMLLLSSFVLVLHLYVRKEFQRSSVKI